MLRLRLLRALRGTPGLTAVDASRVLGVQPATIRRMVSELRAGGVTIDTLGGFYCLREDVPSLADETANSMRALARAILE